MEKSFYILALCALCSLCACSDDNNESSNITQKELTGSWIMADNSLFGITDVVTFDGNGGMRYSGVQYLSDLRYTWCDSVNVPYALENNIIRVKFAYLSGGTLDLALELGSQNADTVKAKVTAFAVNDTDMLGNITNRNIAFIKVKTTYSPLSSGLWKMTDGIYNSYISGSGGASAAIYLEGDSNFWIKEKAEFRVFNNRLIELNFSSSKPGYYLESVPYVLSNVTSNRVTMKDERREYTYEKCTTDDPSLNILTIVGSQKRLIAGKYDGIVALSNVLAGGDFGVGAADCLDGTVSVLNGKAYNFRSDGKMYVLDGNKVPFAKVCKMKPDTTFTIPEHTDIEELFDKLYPDTTQSYAISVEGTFDSLSVVTPMKQTTPYKILPEVFKSDFVNFTWKNISGTMIGFRFGGYMKSENQGLNRYLFLSDDKQVGGYIKYSDESSPLKVSIMKIVGIQPLRY